MALLESFEPARTHVLKNIVDFKSGSVISKTLLKTEHGSITLFSFDQGQGLSEHTAPFDAFVQVLEGEVELTIGGKPVLAKEGETVVMPQNISHALKAKTAFKMLLTMVK